MLNNLSFLSLLIRAEKPKKFRKDRFLNMYLNLPDKGTEPPNRARCVYAHTCLILQCVFFSIPTCARTLGKALGDSSCQSQKLLCMCDHREWHSIVYRSVLNYSCHWAPNLCYHWSSKENMKRIGVVIWWPAGQGDFNIGIIERGICRFSPGPLPSSLSLLSTAGMKTNGIFFSMKAPNLTPARGQW